ncbi:hypothetical protein EDB19DRAFT_1715147 [Suillus lakei]|nr:hypothetical protein EDB19DRAFT_1715147 [Suillus lakei]
MQSQTVVSQRASIGLCNLMLNFDGIAEIVEKGIITKTGEMLLFDAIIYATECYLMFHRMPTAETGLVSDARPRLLWYAWWPHCIHRDCNSRHQTFDKW